MLLPKITIKRLLLVMLACGLFFTILGMAVRGNQWAMAICIPVMILAFGLVLQMGTYLLAHFLGALTPASVREEQVSPFADSDKPSEQLLPPQEQEW